MRPRSSTIDAPGIRELLSYRLHVVANLLSRGAELRYGREFGVSLWEWRTGALLGGAAGAQSLNELARSAGIDKSQMSRVVSGLAARRLVLRAIDDNDGRGVRLTLTRAGRTMPDNIIAPTIGAGIIGGGQAWGAHEAADAEKDTADKAADLQWRMYKQTREDLAPWREAGARAVGTLEGLIGAGPGEFKESPSYRFALEEGQKGIQRAASATGRLGSGAYVRNATKYAENMASTEYDNFLRRWYQSLTPWQSMAGLGQTAGAQTGAAGANAAEWMSKSRLYGGEGQAGQYMNWANILGRQGEGAIGNYLYNYYRNPQNQGGVTVGQPHLINHTMITGRTDRQKWGTSNA